MNLKTLTHSSTFRLMLVYVALFVTSVLVVLAFIYLVTVTAMRTQIDETIDTEIAGLAERFETSGLSGMNNLIRQRVGRQEPTSDSIYLFTDERYRRITGNLDAWPNEARDIENGWIDFALRGAQDQQRTARARVFRLSRGFRLLVGRDVQTLDTLKTRLLSALGWGVALILLLGVMGAFAMTRSLMRRIEAINTTSQSIVRSGDLSRRIPDGGTSDDLDVLSRNLNSMLARIEDLMTGVRQVSDSIAHDLRTPLARLRNRLELARVHKGDHESHTETIQQALDETDGLLRTFNALLRIARLETGDLRQNFRPVSLSALCDDIIELYQPVAEARDQSLAVSNTIHPDPTIQADRDLVFQAVANLVDNAIKFSPDASQIELALHHVGDSDSRDARIALTVRDTGSGIADDHRDRVFDRFYRADASRTGTGNGLGLSLVKAVCDAHGATITLANRNPGLEITLAFVSGKTPA